MTTTTHTAYQKSLLLPEYQNVSVKPRARDYLIDGERYQRVSTIVNIVAKPALVPWAVKETVNTLQETLLSGETKEILQSLLTPEEEGYENWVRQLADIAKAASDKKRDEAAARGTRIHAEIQQALQAGTTPRATWLSPEASRALTWFYAQGYRIVTTEMALWDPVRKIGGTPDVVCEGRTDRLTILDWKSGSGIYGENALQIAAYGGMFKLLTGREVAHGCVGHVTEDGCKPYRIKDLPKATAAYQNALELLRYVRNEKEVWA